MTSRLSVENVAEASRLIDPVFKDTPQFASEPLSRRLGLTVVLKVESVNPIRSFKGRGTDYLLQTIDAPPQGLVCASAGNFGQGLAYAARKRGIPVTVFAATTANPLKVERMRALGAEMVLAGDDFGAAKEAGRRRAGETHAMFIEDGRLAPITEGAGTIALELCRMDEPLDAVLVPLGDGALISGIGLWLRHASPSTRVIGVVAEGAPAMARSWAAGRAVSTERISTIADGIAVRVPIPEAFEDMTPNVDEVLTVTDPQIVGAMRILLDDAGLVVEPAGAAGLAAMVAMRDRFSARRAAVIVTGGSVSYEQLLAYIGDSA